MCENEHRLTIRQVTEAGECGQCGAEVHLSTTKAEVKDVLAEERHSPQIFEMGPDGVLRALVTLECVKCEMEFEGIVPEIGKSAFCSDDCRLAHGAAELARRPICQYCNLPIHALDKKIDRRWKYHPACYPLRRQRTNARPNRGGPSLELKPPGRAG